MIRLMKNYIAASIITVMSTSCQLFGLDQQVQTLVNQDRTESIELVIVNHDTFALEHCLTQENYCYYIGKSSHSTGFLSQSDVNTLQSYFTVTPRVAGHFITYQLNFSGQGKVAAHQLQLNSNAKYFNSESQRNNLMEEERAVFELSQPDFQNIKQQIDSIVSQYTNVGSRNRIQVRPSYSTSDDDLY